MVIGRRASRGMALNHPYLDTGLWGLPLDRWALFFLPT